MTKYSDKFKIKVVQMVHKGNNVESVIRMLNIPLHSTLYAWLVNYNHGSINQIFHKKSFIFSEF
jgi:transposase-like protein